MTIFPNNFLSFLMFEIMVSQKTRGLITALFSFQIMALISLPFFLDIKDIGLYGPQILIFCLSLSIIVTNSLQLLQDNIDGSLIQMSLVFNPLSIVLVKKLSVISVAIALNLLISFFVMFFYGISFVKMIFFFFSSSSVIITSGSISFCSSAIKLYFDNNKEYISLVMLPLLIPIFVCASLAIIHENLFYILLLLGINLILFPIFTLLSSYLLKNSYSLD